MPHYLSLTRYAEHRQTSFHSCFHWLKTYRPLQMHAQHCARQSWCCVIEACHCHTPAFTWQASSSSASMLCDTLRWIRKLIYLSPTKAGPSALVGGVIIAVLHSLISWHWLTITVQADYTFFTGSRPNFPQPGVVTAGNAPSTASSGWYRAFFKKPNAQCDSSSDQRIKEQNAWSIASPFSCSKLAVDSMGSAIFIHYQFDAQSLKWKQHLEVCRAWLQSSSSQ